MAIVFNCSGCGHQLRAEDDAAGRQARCPQCGAVTQIPTGHDPYPEFEATQAETGAADETTPPPPTTRPCPFCGEAILAQAAKCRFCGEYLESPSGGVRSDWTPATTMTPKVRQLRIPSIVLIVLASLGLSATLYNAFNALLAQAPDVDPNLPPILQEIQKGMVGPLAAAIQLAFAIVNGVILAGAIAMLRLRYYGLAMAGAVLSLIDLGSCCCVLTLPFGIWALVLLSDSQVKAAFR